MTSALQVRCPDSVAGPSASDATLPGYWEPSAFGHRRRRPASDSARARSATAGSFSTIRSSGLAGSLGSRQACSKFCEVRTLTSSSRSASRRPSGRCVRRLLAIISRYRTASKPTIPASPAPSVLPTLCGRVKPRRADFLNAFVPSSLGYGSA